MCGISGCLTKNNAMTSIIRALNKLQNRGYDSAGICSVVNNKMIIKKSISKNNETAIQYINSDTLSNIDCDIAIGHTRWATHGPKTIENAHPHHDDEMRFSIVHNGIIENYSILREHLLKQGYSFYGQTDSEIIVKYLHYLDKIQGNYSDLNNIMTGSWAILLIDKHEANKIFILKNGSPLIIGFDNKKSKIMIVSELIAFDTDIDEYFALMDYETGYVSITDGQCSISLSNTYITKPVLSLEFPSRPDPYLHWTIKEINDQPTVLKEIINERVIFKDSQIEINFPELNDIQEYLKNLDHLIFVACGTSFHAAQVGTDFFKEFNPNLTMNVIDGADFRKRDIPFNRKSIIIILSQSGETRDLYHALQIGKKYKIKTIGIINVEKSLIAREVDYCLYIRSGREQAVASTKSFTNQVVMLVLLAIWMSPKSVENKYIDAIKNLPLDFEKIIKKSVAEIPQMIPFFEKQNNCFILGKHANEWIAKEAALKIKEISYIHAEGFSAAALKHGTFALLVDNTPVVVLAKDDKFYPKIENAMAEIKSRNAKVIHITNKLTSQLNADYMFYIDSDSRLFSLLCIVPLQILAYYLSVNRGNNPDYPRNLAKVVTVE